MVYRSQFFGALRQLVGPTAPCLFCGLDSQAGIDICHACETDMPWLGPGCSRCSAPMADADETILCGQCLTSVPPYCRSVIGWHYKPPIARVIANFKYHGRQNYGHSLAILMAEQIVSTYYDTPLPDLVTAIPLHPWRFLRRGFNQSDLVARVIASRLGLTRRSLLRRVRHTAPQQSLTAQQRRRNLRNAFRAKHVLNGESVALVDDVYTTGATAAEASRALIAAGASEVHVWTLAKTTP